MAVDCSALTMLLSHWDSLKLYSFAFLEIHFKGICV